MRPELFTGKIVTTWRDGRRSLRIWRDGHPIGEPIPLKHAKTGAGK